MNCISPIWLNETSDRKGQYVPCSKCYPCMQRKRNIWTHRMMVENREAESGYFVTLTYDQESVPLVDQWGWDVASLHKPDLTGFFKKLRQQVIRYAVDVKDPRWFKASITNKGEIRHNSRLRYFACGEYGVKGDRPHYHAIIWNLPEYFIELDTIYGGYISDMLERTWKKGIVDIGDVTQASCHYVAKYTLDPLIESRYYESDARQRAYATMSKNPGIGANYVTENNKKNFWNNYNSYALAEGGYKQPLGRYLTEKIYEDNVKAMRENRRISAHLAMEYAKEEEQKVTKGLDMTEGYKKFLEYNRDKRKYTNRKIKLITKDNKL